MNVTYTTSTGVRLKSYGLPEPQAEMIGREDEMKELEMCLKEHHRVALVGVEGSGKTTLAHHYGHRWTEYGNRTFVLHSQTEESIIDSLREIGSHLQIGLIYYKQSVPIAEEIWTILKNNAVLLIYDNVESFTTIKNYLPPESEKSFHVLITSQYENYECFEKFKLNGLCQEKANELIQSKLDAILWNSPEKLEDMKELIEVMEGLPLALLLAISYIKLKSLQNYSIRLYLENYKACLLKMEQEFPNWDESLDQYKKTVYIAVMMNIKLMETDNEFKEIMLKIFFSMTLLNPEHIPMGLLTRLCQIEEEVLNEYVTVSSRYSLCKHEQRRYFMNLNVHRLVLEVCEKLLNATEQRYRTNLLVKTTKFIMHADLRLWKWSNHREFILKHLTLDSFSKIFVSESNEEFREQRFKEVLTKVATQLNVIDNYNVYHYGAFYGVIKLFDNIKIFNGGEPREIKSLQQVFENRKSIPIYDSEQCEAWISREDGKVLARLAEEEHEWELARKLVEQGASALAVSQTMFYNTNNKNDNLKYFIALLDGDTDTSSRYNMSALVYEPDNHTKQQYVSELLHKGGKVNITDAWGWSPLHIVVRIGSVDWINILVENGADVNAVDSRSCTPLREAIDKNNVECVRALLNKGADVNSVDEYGQTLLYHAACRESSECVKILLDHGAKMDFKEEDSELLDYVRSVSSRCQREQNT